MKKFLLLFIASVATISMMASGTGDGSSKANAIDFDWDKGVTHEGGVTALWYRVDLAPLYEEENPSLTLYLTNPSNVVGTSVDVSMKATVAGQEESKNYSIAARQYKTYTANASTLVYLKQTEIYLTLKSNGKIKLSAKVFESADLDETCKDARVLKWNTVTSQEPMYSAWWKVDLKPVKEAVKKDAKITITNTGSKFVTLKVGQSLDCPSSGVTKRSYDLAPGEKVIDTVPQSMIQSVQPDELYFGVENETSEISMLVELVDQPEEPIIPAMADFETLHVTDTMVITANKKHYYRISVAEMRDTAKYEPEFTYRNLGSTPAKVSVKMAFKVPAFGTSNTDYELLANGGEEIVVYKKNMLDGLSEDIQYIYLLTECDQDINFYGRFKHVREGKACKTNIDFNWEDGHTQEARTTQWYAVNVADARDNIQDIVVHLVNLGSEKATVKSSLAFSCPYIDLQELSRTIDADGKEVTRRIAYSTYAMLTDTVWIGLETSQDLKFWATTQDAPKKAVIDSTCLTEAVTFNWEEGVKQAANDTVWYLIDMTQVRDLAAKFPTIVVQNLSSTETANIKGELSLECPDSIANQTRSVSIAANGTFTKQLSRNLFENIVQDLIYIRVITDQEVSLQVRLTEEAAGTSCASAIPFNWQTGNSQNANEALWYVVDLRTVMKEGYDIRAHLKNRDNAQSKGYVQVAYSCPIPELTSIQEFKLSPLKQSDATIRNSALETIEDSIVYIKVQGSTALRFWVDTIQPAPFDTITGEGITLTPIAWNTEYTQDQDTAWYIIPQSEIEYARNAEVKMTPVVYVTNLGDAMTIKGEGAFAFPIGKTMMSKELKLKKNQAYKDTIPAGTFEQFLKKDSIIIRVTRPAGAANFTFKAQLTKAQNGNSRKDAIPFRLGTLIEQSANSSIWYKMVTAEWKKNKTMYNKSLRAFTKNVGTITADITVEAYDSYESQVNLLESQGHIRSPKGEIRQRTFPAQVVYGLGDVEIYFRVTTTDTLIFQTYLDGVYADQPYDPAQEQAKLLVPNVQYTIPGDNQEHWYRVCIPYVRNNYKYTHGCTLEYELEKATTIEATATLQDSMTCAMPVRKRTVNATGNHNQGTKYLSEIIAEAVQRGAHRKLDITTFQEDYVDSLLRRYITSDSISAYVRIKSDKPIKARLNMPQITGDDCLNAMAFDWEHGNVNPKGNNTWFMVKLDSTLIPDTCDLRLHVENWSSEDASATAGLRFKCEEKPMVSITKTVPADDERTQDIDRDLLANMGWPSNMLIEYFSEQTTHIWIELIPNTPRDTVRDTVIIYACQGADTIVDGIVHTIDSTDVTSLTWETTFELRDSVKAAMYDSIVTYEAVVLLDPTFPTFDEFGAMPVIKRGSAIDVTAADTWLKALWAAEKTDTIKPVTSLEWQYSTDGVTYVAVDATPLSSERINIKYVAEVQCGDLFEDVFKNTVRDTLETTACNSFEWVISATDTRKYITDTIDSVGFIDTNLGDSIAYLNLTVNNPFQANLELVRKFGNRLLMINRNAINAMPGFENIIDSIDRGAGNVKWYKEATPADILVSTDYYYTLPSGEPLPAGETYYAVLDIPATAGNCGLKGETEHYTIPVGAGAPALVPSLAKPGENIQVINLNPELETIVRLYTSEGLLQATYYVAGQETYTIKAADARGFYMVELSNSEMKSTLRYIVK